LGQDASSNGCEGTSDSSDCGSAFAQAGCSSGCPGGKWWDDALTRKEPSELRIKIEAPTPFTLTFNSQVDVTGEKLPGIEVNVSGMIKYTSGADAVATYQLIPGTPSISVKNPDGGRNFSHFYDQNCDNLGNAWDKIDNPFTFTMFSNNKGMTAYYKTFTKIKSSSGGTIDDFDGTHMVTWAPGCGASTVGGAEVITVTPGYFSNNALRVRTTATGSDNLACAISSPYNAVEGKKINYACYGGRCALCVWGGSPPCLNSPEECGNNIGNWTMCQTTITTSKTGTNIYIYNNNTLGGWSVYDLIEESTFDYDGKTVSGKLLDETNNILYQVGGKSPNCGGARQIIPIDRNINLDYFDGSWHSIGSPKFYDDFNGNDYNGWIVDKGTWGVLNGELNNSGGGGGEEYIHTNWNGWNSNDYLSANINIPSGNDVWLSLRNDAGINYYVQTSDGYKTLQLYVTDETGYYNAKSVDISSLGINPKNWNSWRIEQKGNDMLAYINDINIINTTAEKTTIDNFENGIIGWTPNCGGNTINTTADGYNSIYALNITSAGGDGLACEYTSYNAIKGRKITYSCYGSNCRLGIWNNTAFVNTRTCNLDTGQCNTGTPIDGAGTYCPKNPSGWTRCETTITEVPIYQSQSARIYVYNDGTIGHSSIYDTIEELIKVPNITNGRIQLRTSNPTIALFDDINVDGINYKKDGRWSYPWGCILGTNKIRATYNPTNWFYMGTSSTIAISC
jgi:hypothetical protein